jgi:hypothetical protein
LAAALGRARSGCVPRTSHTPIEGHGARKVNSARERDPPGAQRIRPPQRSPEPGRTLFRRAWNPGGRCVEISKVHRISAEVSRQHDATLALSRLDKQPRLPNPPQFKHQLGKVTPNAAPSSPERRIGPNRNVYCLGSHSLAVARRSSC